MAEMLHVLDARFTLHDVADHDAIGLTSVEKALANGIDVAGRHDEDHANAHVQGPTQVVSGTRPDSPSQRKMAGTRHDARSTRAAIPGEASAAGCR